MTPEMTPAEREWFKRAEDSIAAEFARAIQKIESRRRKYEALSERFREGFAGAKDDNLPQSPSDDRCRPWKEKHPSNPE